MNTKCCYRCGTKYDGDACPRCATTLHTLTPNGAENTEEGRAWSKMVEKRDLTTTSHAPAGRRTEAPPMPDAAVVIPDEVLERCVNAAHAASTMPYEMSKAVALRVLEKSGYPDECARLRRLLKEIACKKQGICPYVYRSAPDASCPGVCDVKQALQGGDDTDERV